MKRYFTLFWAGLTGILSATANWITTILGMTDDSKYGKFIRRVVGTCFASVVLAFTIAILWAFSQEAWRRIDCEWLKPDKIDYYDNQQLSRDICYHEGYGVDGYLFNRDGKKILRGIKWISTPLGSDSLVCYSDGEKRGYFNMYTGDVVIKPQYSHAWIFSDGLASVDDNGSIKFIDQTGKVVIDNNMRYIPGKDGYVFHNGNCVVHNKKGDRLGLMNKEGKMALQPDYFSILPADSFWIVSNGKERTVLNRHLETVLPFLNAKVWINNGQIEATMSDHTIRTYNLKGEVIEDFHISNVEQLMYDTNEVKYTTGKVYDDEGNVTCSSEESEATTIQAIAHCRKYQAEYNWYGLMSPDGKIVTPPSYSDITAIGADLYLCKSDYEHGVILNGRGQRVK